MFEKPVILYEKPKWKKMSQCPYDSCSASSPNVRNALEREIPETTREQAGRHEIKKCTYCGGVWWEEVVDGLPRFVLIGFPK